MSSIKQKAGTTLATLPWILCISANIFACSVVTGLGPHIEKHTFGSDMIIFLSLFVTPIVSVLYLIIERGGEFVEKTPVSDTPQLIYYFFASACCSLVIFNVGTVLVYLFAKTLSGLILDWEEGRPAAEMAVGWIIVVGIIALVVACWIAAQVFIWEGTCGFVGKLRMAYKYKKESTNTRLRKLELVTLQGRGKEIV